jgi:hypothetical protein
MDQAKRVSHALNRLTFGPRPDDFQRVAAIGVDKWIELQLRPTDVDDSALVPRLAPLRTLALSAVELTKSFPTKLMIRSVARGRRGLPSDPYERAVYQVQVGRYEERSPRR